MCWDSYVSCSSCMMSLSVMWGMWAGTLRDVKPNWAFKSLLTWRSESAKVSRNLRPVAVPSAAYCSSLCRRSSSCDAQKRHKDQWTEEISILDVAARSPQGGHRKLPMALQDDKFIIKIIVFIYLSVLSIYKTKIIYNYLSIIIINIYINNIYI